jgi:HlyD family secretion protein
MGWKWILVGIAALLIGVGVGAITLLRQQREEAAAQQAAAAAEPAPLKQISLPGVLGAREIVSIPAPIEGVLEMVMVSVGDEVYENMVLAHVDNTALDLELQLAEAEWTAAVDEANKAESELIEARLEASRADADLSSARSDLEQSQRALERQQMLYREGATPRQAYQEAVEAHQKSQKQFETVRAVARQANAGAETAQAKSEAARKIAERGEQEIEAINFDRQATEILSPVRGVITGMAARQGEEVHPSMEVLFQVAVDLSRMTVTLEPNPAEMALIRPGQTALINVAELPAQSLEGTVTEMSIGRVVVDFANPSPEVRPGLTAQVTILLQ